MNIALDRLLEGIVATLRADVIPHVGDAYARGQAVGVIDLLRNIGPRIEWSQRPIADAVAAKTNLLNEVAGLCRQAVSESELLSSTSDLPAERERLDGMIGDAIARLHNDESQAALEAYALIKAHLRDEQEREMRITAKPLFAEIASGQDTSKGRDGA